MHSSNHLGGAIPQADTPPPPPQQTPPLHHTTSPLYPPCEQKDACENIKTLPTATSFAGCNKWQKLCFWDEVTGKGNYVDAFRFLYQCANDQDIKTTDTCSINPWCP